MYKISKKIFQIYEKVKVSNIKASSLRAWNFERSVNFVINFICFGLSEQIIQYINKAWLEVKPAYLWRKKMATLKVEAGLE